MTVADQPHHSGENERATHDDQHDAHTEQTSNGADEAEGDEYNGPRRAEVDEAQRNVVDQGEKRAESGEEERMNPRLLVRSGWVVMSLMRASLRIAHAGMASRAIVDEAGRPRRVRVRRRWTGARIALRT